ncbi:hypothetical protein IQ265_13835 [Nodosilinea sp. LEGE 06152]|uniref:hypothetical protein n=1 Tax=Nodosilinea sp. LEGE 06152 TaxID=2777966 RepID=UPI0018815A8E|nr:hypothetical protein [Nodosilinea sp. LEGE 06152]MBE9157897.1 hypothetical protein [Nodosilinea sp. LEGE 06152]
MTPEQLELKQLLDANPIAWVNLTAPQRSLLRDTLRPDGEFTPEQRELLRDRWLPVTESQIAQMRSLLPRWVGVAPIADIDGGLWLSADLLTDCMEGTDTYHAIAPMLAMLPITLLDSDRFPQPDEELI